VYEVTRVNKERIVIWCDPKVHIAWKRYAARFRSYEEALKELLRRVGEYEEGGEGARIRGSL